MEAKHYSSYLSYRPSILASSIYHFNTYCSDQNKYKLYPVSMTKRFLLHTHSIKSRASSFLIRSFCTFHLLLDKYETFLKWKGYFELAQEKKKKKEKKLKEDIM